MNEILVPATIVALAAALVWALMRIGRLREANARLAARLEEADRRIAESESRQGDRFRAVAADVLREVGRDLDSRSRQGLDTALAPVRASIEGFVRDMRACYAGDRDDRASLRQSIASLAELNRRVGQETSRLSHALKGDSGFQGRWGEMILANVLEHSGLEPGRWLLYQDSATTDEGRRLRPDAVVVCPRGRRIIIDAKCSLRDYLAMLEADTDMQRAALAKAHVKAVEAHVRTLKLKNYQDYIGSDKADFVIMFMPHEGAYLAAMQADDGLWQRAFDARVVIVSPTHLVTMIKLIEQMWVSDERNTNARLIAEEAVKMLDKLVGAFEDLEKAGTQLDNARAAYDSAMSRMRTGRGSVASRVARLASLGARPSRAVPASLTSDEGISDSPAAHSADACAQRKCDS